MRAVFLQFAAEKAAEEPSGIAVLGIDPKVIVIQGGTFLILFFLIKKFALNGIVKALEDRRRTIEEGVENAERMQKMSEETSQEQEKILARTHKKADEIIDKAHVEAGTIVERAHEKARSQTEKMLSEAEAKIEQSVEQARQELKKEVASLVVSTSETVLREKLDSDSDQRLIERSLKEAGVS